MQMAVRRPAAASKLNMLRARLRAIRKWSNPEISPFRLITTSMSTTSIQSSRAAATSQIVTLPPIPELFDPNFLDILLPAAKVPPTPKGEAPAASNTMMDALRSTAHQTFTTNNAPTFSSTLVSTLDAYGSPNRHPRKKS